MTTEQAAGGNAAAATPKSRLHDDKCGMQKTCGNSSVACSDCLTDPETQKTRRCMPTRGAYTMKATEVQNC